MQGKYKYIIDSDEVTKEMFEAFIREFDCVRTVSDGSIKAVLLNSFFGENKDKNKLIKRELNNHIKDVLSFDTLDKEFSGYKKCDSRCFCDGSCKEKNNLFNSAEKRETQSYQGKGLSTRHKANTPMTYLDEVVGDSKVPPTPKLFRCLTPDESIDMLNTALKNAKKKDENKHKFIEKFKEIVHDNIGVKHNQNKPQLSLLFKQFPKALEAISKCSEYGHEKYKEADTDYLNFKRVEGGSKAYADAGLRHRMFVEKTTDIDSQLPHSYHVAWNALAELELILENK